MNRTRTLLNRPAVVVDGYLDVVGDAQVPQTAGQRVMGFDGVSRNLSAASQTVGGRRPEAS